jgi:hypothetical protein
MESAAIAAALKPVFRKAAKKLVVKADTPERYALVTKVPSPFPQHKGCPLDFGLVQVGKAYVSLHLLPLYMNPTLAKAVTPALKKRMQGKACFNFSKVPEPELLVDLEALVTLGVADWTAKGWL